ncbi:UV radiation resistance-associated gene protein [Clonorchis sinensis]|uniref:UV radiation resistance-associated gene protein n=1 Tax=Clonorchis sinensis TaxID=79923 RepID=G7YKB4_CLOSI|nr:UV radiation resistance-associated gene protein [Clonorchis sinensis]
MMQSMNMLQTSLSGILDLSAKREAGFVELDLLKCRLRAAKADVEELRSRLEQLSDQRSLVEDMLEHIACGRAVISERISTVSRATSRIGSYMMKLDRAISSRISQLIHQLVEIFGTELGALDPKNTVPPDTTTEDVTRPITFVPLSPAHLNLDYPNSAVVRQHTAEAVTADHSLSTNQTVNVVANGSGTKFVNSVESDLVLAASKLGMIAQLLRFIAAVLSHPLRHPLDLAEGTSRAKVTDYLAQELVEGEPNFPLYLSRSSLLPAYKHAVSLLNRDLADLRAFVGLSTSVEETTTWNLCTFLQHCLSEKGMHLHNVDILIGNPEVLCIAPFLHSVIRVLSDTLVMIPPVYFEWHPRN